MDLLLSLRLLLHRLLLILLKILSLNILLLLLFVLGLNILARSVDSHIVACPLQLVRIRSTIMLASFESSLYILLLLGLWLAVHLFVEYVAVLLLRCLYPIAFLDCFFEQFIRSLTRYVTLLVELYVLNFFLLLLLRLFPRTSNDYPCLSFLGLIFNRVCIFMFVGEQFVVSGLFFLYFLQLILPSLELHLKLIQFFNLRHLIIE